MLFIFALFEFFGGFTDGIRDHSDKFNIPVFDFINRPSENFDYFIYKFVKFIHSQNLQPGRLFVRPGYF